MTKLVEDTINSASGLVRKVTGPSALNDCRYLR
jgi:hypothetical protein